jgi:hypothetical protein
MFIQIFAPVSQNCRYRASTAVYVKRVDPLVIKFGSRRFCHGKNLEIDLGIVCPTARIDLGSLSNCQKIHVQRDSTTDCQIRDIHT